MQKTANGVNDIMTTSSMFMLDPAGIVTSSSNTNPTTAANVTAASGAKFAATPPNNFFGFLPADLGGGAPLLPSYLAAAAAAAAAAQHGHHHQHYPIAYVQDEPAQLRKLFIGGLNHETCDDQLRDYYSAFGQVVDCIVIRDPATKHSRGFGFVTYATIKQAEAAMDARPHTINGKVVDPKRAIPRENMLPLTPNNPPHFLETEPAAGCKLTLSGVDWTHHTVDAIRQYFERFGAIEQVEIVGHPRGFGFIVFEDRESTERCLAAGRQHSINGRKVDAKECSPNDPVAMNVVRTKLAAAKNGVDRPAGGHTAPHRGAAGGSRSHGSSAGGDRRGGGSGGGGGGVSVNAKPFVPRVDNEPPSMSLDNFPHLN